MPGHPKHIFARLSTLPGHPKHIFARLSTLPGHPKHIFAHLSTLPGDPRNANCGLFYVFGEELHGSRTSICRIYRVKKEGINPTKSLLIK
jgi:hypothetical protein